MDVRLKSRTWGVEGRRDRDRPVTPRLPTLADHPHLRATLAAPARHPSACDGAMRSPRLTSDGSGGAAGGVTGEEGPVQIVQPPLLHATSPADEQQHAAPPAPKSGAHSEEAAATPYLHRLWPTDSRDVTPFLLRTAASWALIAALLALYLVVFTAMGHGLSVYQALKPAAEYANVRTHC